MVFPLMKDKFYRNKIISRNTINQTKHNTKNNYLNDCFNSCPKCKKQELIEIAAPEENTLTNFCLNCGYKKLKGEITHE